MFGGSRDSVFAINAGGTWTLASTILYPDPNVSLRNIFQGDWWITSVTDDTVGLSGIGIVVFYNSAGLPTVFNALKFTATLTLAANPQDDSFLTDAVIAAYSFVFQDNDPTKSIIGQQLVATIPFPNTKSFRLVTTQAALAMKTLYNSCNRFACSICDKDCKCDSRKPKDTITASQVNAELSLNIPDHCAKVDGYTTLDYAQHGEGGRPVGTYESTVNLPTAFGGLRRTYITLNAGGTLTIASTIPNRDPRVTLRNTFQGDWWITGSDANTIFTTSISMCYFYNALGQVIQYQIVKAGNTGTLNANPLYDTTVSNAVIVTYNFVFEGGSVADRIVGDPSKSIIGSYLLAPPI